MAVESTSIPSKPPRGSKVRLLVAATVVTSLGDGVAVVAFSLMAAGLTNRPLLVAGVQVVSALPWLLVALPMGVLVDRADRRRMVVVVELLRAVLLTVAAVAVAAHRLDIAALYVVVFLVQTGETATRAITNAAVPQIVEHDGQLADANGQVQTAEAFGEHFAGASVAGFVYAVSRTLPFVGDAVSFVGSALLLGRVIPARPATVTGEREPDVRSRLLADVRGGMRYLLADPALRGLTVTVSGLAFAQAMVFGVLVLYVLHVLHAGSTGYGLIVGVAALGTVAGGYAGRRADQVLGPVRTIVWCALVATAAYVALASDPQSALAGASLFVEALAVATAMVSIATLRARIIPNERFGTTVNAMRFFALGLAPLGALAGGAVAGVVGTRATFAVAAGLQALVVAASGPLLQRGVAGRLAGQAGAPPTP